MFVTSAHSGSDVRFPFKELKYDLEKEGTIKLQKLTAFEEFIHSSTQNRIRRYDGLAIQISIAGMIQGLLTILLFSCRHQTDKTHGGNA